MKITHVLTSSDSSLRRHMTGSAWSVPLMIAFSFAVAAGLSSCILTFQAKAINARKAEVLIARLRSETNYMDALEMAVMARDNLTSEANRKADDSSARSAQLILQLNGLVSVSTVEGLEETVTSYEDETRKAITALEGRDQAAGRRIDAIEVDPLETKVIDQVEATDRRLVQEANLATEESEVATVIALLSGALLLSAMIVLFKRHVESAARLEQRQTALIEAERKWNSLIQNVSDIIAVVDAEGCFTFVSPAMKSMLGFDASEVDGKAVHELIHAEDSVVARLVMEQVITAKQPINQDWRMMDVNGDPHECEVALTNLLDDEYVNGILLTFRDVTDRKRFENQLAHQAFHDALTGLPNRALMNERLRSAIERSKRSGRFPGLLFLDLDNFKVVNDSLGHEEGDRLLVELAARLQACVRASDTVARLGGDEFTLLIEEVSDQAELILVAEKVLEKLHRPVALQGRDIFPSGSIGIASSDGMSTSETLLRDADTAMYHAKTSGKASYVVFEPSMSERAMERLELEGDLREALAGNQMFLVYQPIFSLSPSRVCGVEALLRWQHPTRGVVPPVSFIPIAEESGLIVPMGYWVLETACREAKPWTLSASFMLNVNVSAIQLLESDFVQKVANILTRTGFAPDNLKLEITESVVMQNLEDCIVKMRQLRDFGIHVAIDDFGTGYSSMAQLSLLPVDTLKIDRAFVNRIGKGDDDAIIGAIIAMAQSMGLQITSEGIETPEQLHLLESLGCGQGQGYLFAKPMSREALPSFLTSWSEAGSIQEAA